VESRLEKIYRLTGVRPAASVRRVRPAPVRKPPGKSTSPPVTEQVAGGQLQLGSVYRSAWGNVSVGDVVELGSELWKVIPASSYPNHKTPSRVKMPPKTDNSPGGSSSGDASSPDPGSVPTHTVYLQDVNNPKEYDELTLPTSYVVHIVPVAPS
jgi:hypothetical protein